MKTVFIVNFSSSKLESTNSYSWVLSLDYFYLKTRINYKTKIPEILRKSH